MKKLIVLLLGVFSFGTILGAQGSYKLSTSRNDASKNVSMEKIINSESKQFSAKMMKKINSLIGIYLKNGDKAFNNGNYSLAIKNYELAIKNLDGVRGADYFIKMIEKRIEEIKKMNPVSKNGKIKPLINSNSSNSKTSKKSSTIRR